MAARQLSCRCWGNRIYPVSRTEVADLHDEGGDGGCVCGCVCVRARSCEGASTYVFAWAVDCVWFTGPGSFSVALSVWVFSYRG